MKLPTIILSALVILLFASCADEKESTEPKVVQKEVIKPIQKVEKRWDSLKSHNVNAFLRAYAKNNKETLVQITTNFGIIKLRLYNNTPLHRANFIFLTKINYFNSTVFYRVAKNFVIQGGNSDEEYTLKLRNRYGNYLIEPEFRSNRKHKYGALAAAREWEFNPKKLSSPFEFYIVQNKKGAPHLDNEHTVFGEVISGFETMEKISKIEVGIDEWPKVDVRMKVKIIE